MSFIPRFSKWHLFFLLAVVLYLGLATAWIDKPGLEYDEVLFSNAAFGNVDGSFVAWSLPIGETRFPLMLMNYMGAVKAYLYAPIFALFGTSVWAVRLPMILLAALSLWVVWQLVGQVAGRVASSIAVGLLATDPSFIFSTRADYGPFVISFFLKVTGIYLCLKALEKRRAGLLLWAAFLLGVGLYDKVTFLWGLVAWLAVFPLIFWHELKSFFSLKVAGKALLYFMLGCLPFIAYNFRGPLRTFRNPPAVQDPSSATLQQKARVFLSTLNGTALLHLFNSGVAASLPPEVLEANSNAPDWRHLSSVLQMLQGTMLPLALIIALLIIAASTLSHDSDGWIPLALFTSQLFLTMLFFFLTRQASGAHHMILIYPWPQALLGLVCGMLWQGGIQPQGAESAAVQAEAKRPENLKSRRIAISIVLAGLIAANLVMWGATVESLGKQGGGGAWSDGIYDLIRYCKNHPEPGYYCMDWGIGNQLLLAGHGSLQKAELFSQLGPDDSLARRRQWLLPILRRPGTTFIFHAEGQEVYRLRDLALSAARDERLTPHLLTQINQRNQRPFYLLYQFEDNRLAEFQAAGGRFVWKEAEQWQSKRGGGVDFRPAALMGKALGNRWGRASSDQVCYELELSEDFPDAQFSLRYALDSASESHLHVGIDQHPPAPITLSPVGGNGNFPENWRWMAISMGRISKGKHTLCLSPAGSSGRLELDAFAVTNRPYPW